jgi:hypothetical protein
MPQNIMYAESEGDNQTQKLVHLWKARGSTLCRLKHFYEKHAHFDNFVQN